MNKLSEIYTSDKIKNFLFSMMLFGVVSGLYNGVFNNYLHDILSINRLERGWLEMPRELPGLLLFVLIALLNRFTEIRLIRLAFVIAAVGIGGLFLFGESRLAAIIFIVAYSTGEHLMMPIRQSVGLHMARPEKSGLAMGVLRSFGNAGQAVGYYLAPLILLIFGIISKKESTGFVRYRIIFIIAFIVLIIGLVITSRMQKTGERVKRKKIYIHRKYTRYYLLEVFFGARKQVFFTFAPYVLITVYNAGPELISVLYGIWSIVNIFIGPLIGRLIDKAGYKKVLIFDSIVLILICLLYGFAQRIFPANIAFLVICIVFVLDAIMFAFGMARDMYVRSLSKTKDEVTSTLATGLSVNHLVSIGIAIFGGFLWQRLGIEFLFGFAAVLGVGSLVFSCFLHKPPKEITLLK
ncbi:MAG TPA: MFS transporter [Spirochaeta sp.]|nr:MFS transporter [Spirochaeta sp.]